MQNKHVEKLLIISVIMALFRTTVIIFNMEIIKRYKIITQICATKEKCSVVELYNRILLDMDLKEGFLSQVTLELRSENEGVN